MPAIMVIGLVEGASSFAPSHAVNERHPTGLCAHAKIITHTWLDYYCQRATHPRWRHWELTNVDPSITSLVAHNRHSSASLSHQMIPRGQWSSGGKTNLKHRERSGRGGSRVSNGEKGESTTTADCGVAVIGQPNTCAPTKLCNGVEVGSVPIGDGSLNLSLLLSDMAHSLGIAMKPHCSTCDGGMARMVPTSRLTATATTTCR